MRNEDYSGENLLIDRPARKPEIINDPQIVFVDDVGLSLKFVDRYCFIETLRHLTKKRIELYADSDDRPRVQAPPRMRT
jgi:hypothetical protein